MYCLVLVLAYPLSLSLIPPHCRIRGAAAAGRREDLSQINVGFGGGKTTRRRRNERPGIIHDYVVVYYPWRGRRKYVGYTTCVWVLILLLSLCCFFSTCWLWRRDSDEEDGGDDDGTRGRRKYVGYTTCLKCVSYTTLFFISCCLPPCFLSLVVSHICLPHAGYGGGTTTKRRDEEHRCD